MSRPYLVAIVAMTSERVIGRDGALPWHIPDDLKFFKRTTNGHPVVMGRKTYESIGKPLPNRRNIVLTRDPAWSAPGVETIRRPEDLDGLPGLSSPVFIIGGARIYQTFLPLLDEMIVTLVHKAYPGDVIFPEFASRFPASEVMESNPDFEIRRFRAVEE